MGPEIMDSLSHNVASKVHMKVKEPSWGGGGPEPGILSVHWG